MTAAYAVAAATAPLVALTLYGEARETPWRGAAKAAASTGFIATAVLAGATDSPYGWWVLAALCLGWVGDLALVSAQRRWFVLGLGAFLLSHLAYIGAFATVRPNALVAGLVAAGLVTPAGFVVRWLWPHLERRMRGPVLAYIAVITAMTAAAAGAVAGLGPGAPATAALTAGEPIPRWAWQAAVMTAAAAFFVSDLLVARHRFVTRAVLNRLVGLPLYYAAQLLFALSTGWL